MDRVAASAAIDAKYYVDVDVIHFRYTFWSFSIVLIFMAILYLFCYISLQLCYQFVWTAQLRSQIDATTKIVPHFKQKYRIFHSIEKSIRLDCTKQSQFSLLNIYSISNPNDPKNENMLFL